MIRFLILALAVTTVAAAQQPLIHTAMQGQDLVVTIGPVNLPAHADHMAVQQPALQSWQMPAGGWIRGYRVDMVDGHGTAIAQETLHHAELVDLGRRDLLRRAYNRIISAGKETAALSLPDSMGYPVRAGQRLGVNAMLANPTRTAYPAAYVRITLTMIPDTARGIRSVLGMYAETSELNPDSTNGDSSYDLMPGHSERMVHFTVPIGGIIFGMGGHIHDYGTRLVLTRMSGDTVYDGVPRKDRNGVVLSMPRVIDSIRVNAGEMFMMNVVYDNPTGRMLEGAAMGTLGVAFIPDDVSQWPALNENDPAVRADLTSLQMPSHMMMHQGTQMQMHHH